MKTVLLSAVAPVTLSVAALSVVTLSACVNNSEANMSNFARVTAEYLDKRGQLCLGKRTWPIDVTPAEVAAGARNAVQMPVLEKLGLVTATDIVVPLPTAEGAAAGATAVSEGAGGTLTLKRYSLTDEGKKYYIPRQPPTVPGPGRAAGEPGRDFCAAQLTLDRVIGWEIHPTQKPDTREAVVTYTYKVDPAPWTSDLAARRAFPAVARVIQGAGVAQLKESFTLSSRGWVPSDHLQ